MNGDNPLLFAEAMMLTMREYFDRDGHLDPVAFVLATRDYDTKTPLPEPEAIVLPLRFRNQEDKDEAADMIREVATKTKAVGILCGFETWMLRHDNEETLKEAIQKGLKDHPDREEIIFVKMEHQRGEFTWVGEIKRDPDGKATLGQFKLNDSINLDGRFSNMLPKTPVKFDA